MMADSPGPPPLIPFGLVLHHDGSWTHEGQPILHQRMREVFDRSVRYLPEEDQFVVQIGSYCGVIEVEEAAFFIHELDFDRGMVRLSDGCWEEMNPQTLQVSERDGACLCRVRENEKPGGILARFQHGAQSDLFQAIEVSEEGAVLHWAGRRVEINLD